MSDNKNSKKTPSPKPPTSKTVKGDEKKLEPIAKSKGNSKK